MYIQALSWAALPQRMHRAGERLVPAPAPAETAVAVALSLLSSILCGVQPVEQPIRL